MKQFASRIVGWVVGLGVLFVVGIVEQLWSGLGLPGIVAWPLAFVVVFVAVAALFWGWGALKQQRLESKPGVRQWNQLDNQAFALQKRREFAAASAMFEQAVPLAEATNQPIVVATAANNLAASYSDEGRWAEAATQFLKAYRLRQQALGVTDGLTLTTGERLCGAYAAAGRWTDVEALQRELLPIYEKEGGRDDLTVLAALHTIGVALRHQGRYTEAVAIYQDEEARLRSKNQLESEMAGTLFNDWAYLMVAAGSPAAAIPVYDRAIAIREKDVANPLALGASLDNRADAQARVGDAAGAAVTSQRWFELMDRILSREGVDGQAILVQPIDQHAARLEAAGRIDEARELRERAGEIRARYPEAVSRLAQQVAQMAES